MYLLHELDHFFYNEANKFFFNLVKVVFMIFFISNFIDEYDSAEPIPYIQDTLATITVSFFIKDLVAECLNRSIVH